ncbi:MAG: Methyltransferase type 11 [Acidobacteria bacterium]|nr:Methyltransferase type 11 [Acidobacteriota bacterium]
MDEPTAASSAKRWDPALYDSKHSFVWKYGLELIELLAPQRGERILDLGCGTGHLTNQIALSGAAVTGLDISQAMIEQARQNYPDLEFVPGDAAAFAFQQPFDAVFSNAALHWVKRPEAVVECVAHALHPGGRFVAEFGGKGNIAAIHAALRAALRHALQGLDLKRSEEWNPWYYPSVGEYATLLERHGLAVRYATLFDRPTPLEEGERGLRLWLEMFAGELLDTLSPSQREDVIRSVEERLRPAQFRDGTWYADYARIRVMARRSGE